MESWSYISRAEEFVHNESVPATDGSVRNENGLMGWELKASSAFGTGSFMSSSNQEGLKNPQLIELGSAERITSNTDKGSVTDVFSSKFGCGEVYSTPIANSGEEESSIKLSSSVMESNYRDTPLIDLKLGRFPDHKDAQGNVNPNFSSAESSMPAKRLRAGKLTTQIPYCQVYGCKKDLSNCKDYHKRHKVCEIHSKTAKVIVNGIDQRFCQQCSRFHLLSEFDDGKRSCRKRLAGHNERRRKPHVGMHSGRGGRFFQPYNGTRFNGTSFALSSSVYRDRLPSSLLHAQKYEMNDWYRNLRVENDADYVPRHGISYSESQYPDVHDDELIEVTRSKNNSFLHNMSSPGCVSRSLFRNSSIGSEELTTFDSFPTGQRLPAAASNSGCALSLLSCQSQIAPNIPSSIPTGLPLITPSSHSTYSTSTSGVSNMFPTSGITSADETHMDPILISDGIGSDKYGINEFLPSSSAEFRNTKNQISCGDGSTTINLLQLSSQLQQVEHQRQYMQVKQEDDTLFGLRIT